jgi:putative restriction endonuclease
MGTGNKADIQTVWDELIPNIRVWKRESERAVHKPLLTSMLLARAQQGKSNRVLFKEIDEDLREVLKAVGPSRLSYHSEYPFWYLQNDGFWVVEDKDALPKRKGKDQPTRKTLLEHNAAGFVPIHLWGVLTSEPGLIPRLAMLILEDYWPKSEHPLILNALGLRFPTEPPPLLKK